MSARFPLSDEPRRGLISVVVPFYGVQAYLDACLRSLRFQDYPKVQIILVDDGSLDGSLAIARSHARRDPRIQIVRQPNGGLSAARNTGVRYARGEFITFVDSDDTVRRTAYSEAVATLRASGSEFALLGYRRLKGVKTSNPGRWIRDLHSRPQQRASIDERPDALLNAVAWSKVYRTEFFRSKVPQFPVGRLFEDQPVSAAAFAAATAFDILPGAGINWRIREDGSSISQQEHQVENMRAQMDACIESIHILRDSGHDAAADARAEQILGRNLNFYTDTFLASDDDPEFRSAYAGYADVLLQMVGEVRTEQIMPLRQRLIYRLAGQVPLAELKECLDRGWASCSEQPVRRGIDGRYFLDSPLLHVDPWAAMLTESDLRLGHEDLKLTSGLVNHRFENDRLVVDGWAYISGVASALDQGNLSAWLQGPDGQTVSMDVERLVDERIDERSGDHFADHRAAGFRASVPIVELTAAAMEKASLYVSLELDGEVQQECPTRGRQSEPNRTVWHEIDDETVVTASAFRGPLRVTVGKSKTPQRQQDLKARTPGKLLDFIGVDDGFTVHIELTNPAELLGFELVGGGLEIPGTVVDRDAAGIRVHFANHARQWGGAERPLPSGDYYLRVLQVNPSPSRDLWVAPSLGDRLPLDTLTSTHRVKLRSRNDYSRAYPVIEVSAPVPVSDRGWRNHRRLVDTYASQQPTHEGFFFRSLYGEVANCNGLGVHEEVMRQGLDVPLYWSVKDLSVPVPSGGIAVIEGTEDWHRAIRAARHLLVNVHQHPWYRKAPGQIIIETFHGYPYKLMGHDWWAFRGFPTRQVLEFDDRARDWDYVVSPASYSTPLLQHAFTDPPGSAATYLDIGYPRNDVLLRPDEVDQLRQDTRARLQIPPNARAVLYAPTFRDYLSADDMTAEFADLLDVRRLADQLGPDHVLLLRGHPFNARGGLGSRTDGARIIDVTTYPDINHLYAASDAAVLDYSSARFDFALTDKPMVFFVPDLEQYHENRPGLADYRSTAPGPLLRTVEDVAEALRNPERMQRVYRQARETFLAEYVDLDDGKAGARLLTHLGF